MKFWVSPEDVGPYLAGVYDAGVADFQVLVWGDLPTGMLDNFDVTHNILSANLIACIELDDFIKIA